MSKAGSRRAQTTVRRGKPAARQAPPRAVRRVPLTTRILARLPVSPEVVRRVVAGLGVVGIGVIGYAAAAATGVTAWVQDETVAAIGRAGFEVKRVEVVGANRIDRLHVYDIVLRERDRSMAAVDLAQLRADLLSYGWVGDARVSRRLPDTLVVELVERAPAALWQDRGRLSLIDDRGTVLQSVEAADAQGLPVIVGARANLRMGELEELMAVAPALRPQLAGATWVGNRRWDLRFRTGEVLALPEGQEAAADAVANFARMDGINRLLGRGIVRFDMRSRDRLVLRPGREGNVDDLIAQPGVSSEGG